MDAAKTNQSLHRGPSKDHFLFFSILTFTYNIKRYGRKLYGFQHWIPVLYTSIAKI